EGPDDRESQGHRRQAQREMRPGLAESWNQRAHENGETQIEERHLEWRVHGEGEIQREQNERDRRSANGPHPGREKEIVRSDEKKRERSDHFRKHRWRGVPPLHESREIDPARAQQGHGGVVSREQHQEEEETREE